MKVDGAGWSWMELGGRFCNTHFFIFENVLQTTKNFQDYRKFFQVLVSIFYKGQVHSMKPEL